MAPANERSRHWLGNCLTAGGSSPRKRRRRPRATERILPLRDAVSEAKRGRNAVIGSTHIGLAAVGAAIAVGLIGVSASVAVGRNPGAATKVMVQAILAIAFAEGLVFCALFLVR